VIHFILAVLLCFSDPLFYIFFVDARSQVVRIFDMFYQPWVRVFVDVRGSQYDVMKPKFADNRRLFRFNITQCFDRQVAVVLKTS